MPLRRLGPAITAALALVVAAAPIAVADQGHVTDPAGDFPDILRLDYNNAAHKVVMTMKFDDASVAQNQSFYVQWGTPKRYQVFHSPGIALTELRFYPSPDDEPRTVDCEGLRVTEDAAADSTKVVIPRPCIRRAPDTLRFRGIATAGVSLDDKTALSPNVKRA